MSIYHLAAALLIGTATSAAQAAEVPGLLAYSMSKGGKPFVALLDEGGVATGYYYATECSQTEYVGGFAGRYKVSKGDQGWFLATSSVALGPGYIVGLLLDKKASTFGIWVESTSAGVTFQEVNAGPMYKTGKRC